MGDRRFVPLCLILAACILQGASCFYDADDSKVVNLDEKVILHPFTCRGAWREPWKIRDILEADAGGNGLPGNENAMHVECTLIVINGS